MTPEGKIKTACLRYLEKRGIKAWNNPSGAVEVRPGQWLHFGKRGECGYLGLPARWLIFGRGGEGGAWRVVLGSEKRDDIPDDPEERRALAERIERELGLTRQSQKSEGAGAATATVSREANDKAGRPTTINTPATNGDKK